MNVTVQHRLLTTNLLRCIQRQSTVDWMSTWHSIVRPFRSVRSPERTVPILPTELTMDSRDRTCLVGTVRIPILKHTRGGRSICKWHCM